MSPHPIVRGAVARAQQLVEELRDFRVFVGVTQLVDLVEYLEPAGERLDVTLVVLAIVGPSLTVGRSCGADDFDRELAVGAVEVDRRRRAVEDGVDRHARLEELLATQRLEHLRAVDAVVHLPDVVREEDVVRSGHRVHPRAHAHRGLLGAARGEDVVDDKILRLEGGVESLLGLLDSRRCSLDGARGVGRGRHRLLVPLLGKGERASASPILVARSCASVGCIDV